MIAAGVGLQLQPARDCSGSARSASPSCSPAGSARHAAAGAARGLAAQARPIPARADRGRRDRDRRRVEPDRQLQPPLGAQSGSLRLRPRQPRPGAVAARGARDLAGRGVRRHPDVGRGAGSALLPRRPDRARGARPRPAPRPSRARLDAAGPARRDGRRLRPRGPVREPLHRRQGARDPRPGRDRDRPPRDARRPRRSGAGARHRPRPRRRRLLVPGHPQRAGRPRLARQPARVAGGIVADEPVLFLGRDDFIGWELRGSDEITGIVTNFYDVEDARPRFKKGEGGGEKFDVDAVFPSTLDSFRYILATTGGPASGVPPRFREVARTRDYVLYENTGRTGKRRTLDEGTAPGAVLDCKDPEQRPVAKGKGTAMIWNVKPVIAEPYGWTPSDTATDGRPRRR